MKNIAIENINIPQVISEISSEFFKYEQALTNNDIILLDNLFWHDARTVRFGITENLYGIKQIQTFRKSRSPLYLKRTLNNTVITTFNDNYAVCSTEFKRNDINKIGRQQQTWIKMSHGWCIVAAHVSLMI